MAIVVDSHLRDKAIGEKGDAAQHTGTPKRLLDLALASPHLMVESIGDKNRTQWAKAGGARIDDGLRGLALHNEPLCSVRWKRFEWIAS